MSEITQKQFTLGDKVFFIIMDDYNIRVKEGIVDRVANDTKDIFIIRCEKDFDLLGNNIEYTVNISDIWVNSNDIFNHEFMENYIKHNINLLKIRLADEYLLVQNSTNNIYYIDNIYMSPDDMRARAEEYSKGIDKLMLQYTAIAKAKKQSIDKLIIKNK